AGTWRQAFRSLDGGAAWTSIGSGMEVDRDVFTIAIDPHDPDALLAGTCGFLYASADCGRRWSVRKRGVAFEDRRVHTIALPPLAPQEVWAGTQGGIYRSMDGASSFELVRGGIAVSAIVTDPDGERVWAATEEVGVLRRGADR